MERAGPSGTVAAPLGGGILGSLGGFSPREARARWLGLRSRRRGMLDSADESGGDARAEFVNVCLGLSVSAVLERKCTELHFSDKKTEA